MLFISPYHVLAFIIDKLRLSEWPNTY